jgi:PAS domain S-box-containing protein
LGEIEYVNPKFCEASGYSFEEVRGKNSRLLKSGEMSAEFYQQMWAQITAGQEWRGEFCNRRKNGELYWVSTTISPLRDARGKATHFIAVQEDITKVKRAEEALRASQRLQAEILNNIPDPAWLKDAQGRYVVANQPMASIFGQSLESIIGRTISEIFPDRAAEFLAGDIAVISSGKPVRGENCLVDAAGLSRCFETVESPIFNVHGGYYGMVGIARDITERKRGEEALQGQLALREQLAKIAANAPGIIYSFRLRPDGSSCIPYASPTIEKFCGARAEELVNNAAALFKLIHADDLPHIQESIAESARNMLPWRAEFRVQHPKKGRFWVEGQSTPEREADGGILWHGFMSDITERKQAQADREKLERQVAEHKANEESARLAFEHEQESSRIKSRFVSLVSHEFRTPLSIINMAAELLDGYLDKLTEAERAEHLKEIKSSVGRMTEMMNDFLIHGNCANGKMACQPARVKVEVFCRRLIAEVPDYAGSPRAIECAVDPAVGEVWLDENILRHILGNLLSNAVKYSSVGQPVKLEVRRVDDGPQPNGGPRNRPGRRPALRVAGCPEPEGGPDLSAETHLEFKVTDSGIGIPAADMAKLYQTFHRAANVGNRPGTGMGLTIVKQFVELHRGTIRFESQEGKGTTVWVELPSAAPASPTEN